MTYSVANVTTTQWARYLANLPRLIGPAGLERGYTEGAWRQGGWGADNYTSTRYLPKYAWDDDPTEVTRPTEGRAPNQYFLLKAIDDDGQSPLSPFDVVGIIGHNFSELVANDDFDLMIEIQVSDDQDWLSHHQVIARWSGEPSDAVFGRALWCFRLGNADNGADPTVTTAGVYSDVKHLRIRIMHDGTVIPAIGKVFIGRSQFLPHRPNRPYDDKQLASSARVTSFAGEDRSLEQWAGQRVVNASFSPDTIAYENLFRQWFSDTLDGKLLSVWAERPLTSPRETFLVETEPKLNIEHVEGRRLGKVKLSLLEVPPFALPPPVSSSVAEEFVPSGAILWAFNDGPLTCANSGTLAGADLTWAFYYGYGAFGEEPADVPDAGVEGLYDDCIEVHLPHIAHGPPTGFGSAASAYSAADNGLDLSGDFSLEFILKNTATPEFNFDVFLQKRTGATSPGDTSAESAIAITNNPGGGDRIVFTFLGSLSWTMGPMADFSNAWNQIGVTHTAAGLYKFYRNGVLVHSDTNASPINFGADGPWVLGHKAYFVGKSSTHTRWQRAIIANELFDDAYFAASWAAANS